MQCKPYSVDPVVLVLWRWAPIFVSQNLASNFLCSVCLHKYQDDHGNWLLQSMGSGSSNLHVA